MAVHYFGIRHHGPGCARALQAALAELQPDLILLEGPPEADELLAMAADPAMQPPVALLVYPLDAPRHGVFYPFAEFSPEWQAIRHAALQQVPIRFMDLPPTHGFADAIAREAAAEAATPESGAEGAPESGAEGAPESAPETGSEAADDAAPLDVTEDDFAHWRMDPVGELSRAAGYDDNELWWEIEIEQRRDAREMFTAIAEAMSALREHAPPPDQREARREAHMRQCIREAQKAGHERIAVVCGAWHVPALQQPTTIKDDQALLKGLAKTKVAATWVPWSSDRLAYASGYGAGVTSPGWYRHLWHSPDRAGLRWITEAARLMRKQGLDASSASVIETVRMADSLAALRGLPLPGLTENRDAMLAVLCHGNDAPLALIHRELEVGHLIGKVPASATAAPLQRDLEAQQKRLRMKATTEIKPLDLDLREDGGRERSRLLHRLRVLQVDWGTLQRDNNRTGTFRESWSLQWRPELAVELIEASRYGNTIAEAAGNRLREAALQAAALPELTDLLDDAVLAQLPQTITTLLGCVQNQAAVAADLGHLMDALPPLVRVARYGDVRGTQSGSVQPIIESLVERITVGLGGAASHIDETAAEVLLKRIDTVQVALDTLELPALRDDWFATLQRISTQDGIAALVRGGALRLLFDRQRVDAAALAQQAQLALSGAVPPQHATGWLTGLLRGSGLLLLQHDALWQIIDAWLSGLGTEVFMERLPLLRRAFAGFSRAERRQMGNKINTLGSTPVAAAQDDTLDDSRAALVLPVLALLLGPATAPTDEITA
ncbi:hypothetical protein SAMN02745857_02995 [Andreprevotia lacus DSM 23236]|jgi:hypothetical protein|uniref:Uncharacterized protein n=1 Tax=Andreprevotia lacus DSM 23236 TaxID=1121001 RepID=A0A1W1XVF9_9NEIS|nr:DUF5682 family protein [Andreprevotia lacus]SMC27852.1 hypothetical protein SAMN02745857_02995 [Andreprevotia lacus DSM 23236]